MPNKTTVEVEQRVLPWRQRKLEEAAAFVLKNDKLMGFLSAALRLVQGPFVRAGGLKTAGDRQLPGLAPRSFRQLWAAGALEEKK